MKLGYILIILLTSLDQLTKQLIKFFLMDSGDNLIWIPGLLEVQYHTNTGASFGMLDGQMVLFFVITIVALIFFGYLFKDVDFKTKRVYSISVVFFIAGTLGNGIDRLIYGFVIDFFHYPFLEILLGSWGSFYNNIADLLLTAAMIMFSIDLFFLENKRKSKEVIREDETNSPA